MAFDWPRSRHLVNITAPSEVPQRSPAPRSPARPNVPIAQRLPPAGAAGAVVGGIFDVGDMRIVAVVYDDPRHRPPLERSAPRRLTSVSTQTVAASSKRRFT